MVDKPIFELGTKGDKPGIPDNTQVPETWGHFLCVGPPNPPRVEEVQNRYSNLNFTGPPGAASGIYFSLVFMLPKWEWRVEKADEWVDVSPTHKEYYERTVANKQMLESTIKTGLISAAQAAADYELISHDIRKYKEILSYFQENDKNVLKSMFIDQVDVHTDLPGQPIALRTIVSRWPTIIADFMALEDDDIEPNKIATKYNISRAEAVILATKNRLYKQWKQLFGNAAKERYNTLKGIVTARGKSVKEYREWLKPYIARFKMTRIGGERADVRSSTLRTFADITGMSTFANKIRLFAWKPLKFAEHKKPSAEIRGKFVINPYDDYIREHLILNTETGLANLYPWLQNPRKYCSKCKKFYAANAIKCEKCGSIKLEDKKYADELIMGKGGILDRWKEKDPFLGLDPAELYYMFLDIDVFRTGVRVQTGESEDIVFLTKIFTMSQNAILVKMLELKCRDLELERYIDEMIGVKFDDKEILDLIKEDFPNLFGKTQELTSAQAYMKGVGESIESYKNVFKNIKLPKFGNFAFVRPGPYETILKERVTKHYLKYAAGHLGIVTEFLKQKMGVE
jgi:hypothetical protein